MAESKTEKMRQLFADKQVSTEQLEDVAGGCTAQIAQDSRYLNVLLRGHPDQCDRYGETRAMYETESIGAEVTKAWAAVGITYQINSRGLNSYKDAKTGHPLNWVEAQKLAEQRMGKQLNYSDWYWD